MFRQSIDPRGGFPPKGTRKSKPKKAKTGLKKRRSKKQSFERERKAEQVFRFGEVRSGLSGRSVYNPNDFIRFHQSAQFNKQRDEAERTRGGGTFTGTSIGEEKKVKEAQEVDRRFKERQLQVQERFAGALENFVDRVPKPRKPRVSTGDFDALLQPSNTIPLDDRPRQVEDRSGVTIEEIQNPPPIPQNDKGKKLTQGTASQGIAREQPQPEPEPQGTASQGIAREQPLLQEETRRRVIEDPVPEEQSYASHRKPEDDLNVKGSTSRGLPRQTSGGSIGSLSRQSSGSSVIEAVTQSRPRPTPSNPSKTDTIPSDHFSERRTAEQVKQVVVPTEIQKLLFQVKPEEKKPQPQETEEDIPDLEPTLSLPPPEGGDVLAYREGESVSERAERLARDFPQEKPKFKVKTSDTTRKVEEDKPETELQKELREKEEAETKRQQELVRQANERRKVKMAERFSQLSGAIDEDRLAEFDEFELTPEPEPLPQVPVVEAQGQVEDYDDIKEWLDTLEDTENNSFHTGKVKNQMTNDTFSFVDTDGIIGRGKFKGQEVVILAINKKANVLVQLKDATGTGQRVGDEVRGNISYKKFLEERKNLDLKPFALPEE